MPDTVGEQGAGGFWQRKQNLSGYENANTMHAITNHIIICSFIYIMLLLRMWCYSCAERLCCVIPGELTDMAGPPPGTASGPGH